MTTSDRSVVARQIRDISRLEGTFTLRSGAVSNTYFDKYRFEADPALLRAIGEAMVPLIPSPTTVLAGLELGGIPLVTMLGQLTGLPTAFVRKEAKRYGTCRYAEGAALDGEKVLIVEDVVSSGGAILDTLAMLRDDDIHPEWAVCVIDRQTGGVEALAETGVTLKTLFTMADIEAA